MSQFPGQMNAPGVRPHRGTMILVLGILGIVICVICGIIAWVMGNNDLREMQAGTMDRSGEGMTKAGKICGMVGVILWVVAIAIQVVFWVIAAVAIGAGAAASGGAGTP